MGVKLGVDVQFRHANNRFYADLIISGVAAEFITHEFAGINLDFVKYSGLSIFSFSTGLSPLFIKDKTLDQVISAASHVQVNGNGNAVNFRVFIQLIQFFVSLLADKPILKLISKGANLFKLLGFDLKYDPDELANTIKEIIAGIKGDGYEALNQQYFSVQTMIGGFIEQGKQMVMFIQDFLEMIKNVDIDNISVSVTSPLLRSCLKVYIYLPGLTNFINDNFLNQ